MDELNTTRPRRARPSPVGCGTYGPAVELRFEKKQAPWCFCPRRSDFASGACRVPPESKRPSAAPLCVLIWGAGLDARRLEGDNIINGQEAWRARDRPNRPMARRGARFDWLIRDLGVGFVGCSFAVNPVVASAPAWISRDACDFAQQSAALLARSLTHTHPHAHTGSLNTTKKKRYQEEWRLLLGRRYAPLPFQTACGLPSAWGTSPRSVPSLGHNHSGSCQPPCTHVSHCTRAGPS